MLARALGFGFSVWGTGDNSQRAVERRVLPTCPCAKVIDPVFLAQALASLARLLERGNVIGL